MAVTVKAALNAIRDHEAKHAAFWDRCDKRAAPDDPLLRWHADARAVGIDPDRLQWHDDRVIAMTWQVHGLSLAVREIMSISPTGGILDPYALERHSILYRQARERVRVRRIPGKAEADADMQLRQKVFERVLGMRYLVSARFTVAPNANRRRRNIKKWRSWSGCLWHRVAFWSDPNGARLVAGVADARAVCGAALWLANAEPKTLDGAASRLLLCLRGNRDPNLGGINATKNQTYGWILDDIVRARGALLPPIGAPVWGSPPP